MPTNKKEAPEPALFLVDNGSLRADSTFALRLTADRLTARLGRLVAPVSLLHSSKVPPAQLDGLPAETFIPALKRRLHAGQRRFRVLPFFFGPSRALTEYIPDKVAELKKQNPAWANLDIDIAPPLHDLDSPGDNRLARALVERVDSTIARHQLDQPAVILVDHGSPAPAVTEVRNQIGTQLKRLLGGRCRAFSVASMERREGSEYDFNEPLLERVLREPDFARGPVVVALLFLSPGRHAGEGGDIAEICTAAQHDCPTLRTYRTTTLGNHSLLDDILAERADVS
ncbi:MAG: sirohydrochlorin chelatase [Puniceicoccales bacterium]